MLPECRPDDTSSSSSRSSSSKKSTRCSRRRHSGIVVVENGCGWGCTGGITGARGSGSEETSRCSSRSCSRSCNEEKRKCYLPKSKTSTRTVSCMGGHPLPLLLPLFMLTTILPPSSSESVPGLPRGILITFPRRADLRQEVDDGPRHVAEPEEP